MRIDFQNLLTERPRFGSHNSNRQVRALRRVSCDEDGSPIGGLSMKPRHPRGDYGQKQLNEFLSPLYRFVAQQVGRPWDRVYSEI